MTPLNIEKTESAIQWNTLVEKYPVGKPFTYLGIPMVISYSKKTYPEISGSYHFMFIAWKADPIRAEYVDNNGVIREKVFDETAAYSCLPMPTENNNDDPLA